MLTSSTWPCCAMVDKKVLVRRGLAVAGLLLLPSALFVLTWQSGPSQPIHIIGIAILAIDAMLCFFLGLALIIGSYALSAFAPGCDPKDQWGTWGLAAGWIWFSPIYWIIEILMYVVSIRRRAAPRWLPELAWFEDDETRHEVYRRVERATCAQPGFWLWLLLILCPVVSVVVLIDANTGPLLRIGGFSSGTALGVLGLWRLRELERHLLRSELIRRGLCDGCGYDLRGSAGGVRCPECGAPVEGVSRSTGGTGTAEEEP